MALKMATATPRLMAFAMGGLAASCRKVSTGVSEADRAPRSRAPTITAATGGRMVAAPTPSAPSTIHHIFRRAPFTSSPKKMAEP